MNHAFSNAMKKYNTFKNIYRVYSACFSMVASLCMSLCLCIVLRFVGPGDDLRSCRFTQMMEQRLENAFAEAEAIVMNSHSGLTVQVGRP